MSLEELISFFENPNPTPLQKIEDKITKTYQVNLYIKRLDLVHPLLSGNKFYKLKQNLIEAKRLNINSLVTFGGAFSNHLYAVAAAGKLFGFETIGIVRGDELNEKSSKTLEFADSCGMRLEFVSRSAFKNKAELALKFPNSFIIPEGGTNQLAIDGIKEIFIENNPEIICSSFGTGGTSAGILEKYGKNSKVMVFSSLKIKSEEVVNEIQKLTTLNIENLIVNTDYTFGGYGRYDEQLVNFILNFEEENQILLDPIYTGKMMFGIYDLMLKGYFKPNLNIAIIHSGGLQGRNF